MSDLLVSKKTTFVGLAPATVMAWRMMHRATKPSWHEDYTRCATGAILALLTY